MAKYIIDRRRFLRRSGEAFAVVTALGGVIFTDTARSYAIEMANLAQNEADTLLKMCRLCYPHDFVEDLHYASVVEVIDGEAADADTAEMIKNGVAELDADGPFLEADEDTQYATLEAMQNSAFFQKVRGSVVNNLYNNQLVWPKFGYEGESFSKGGYIDRGFQDAGWLPTPPADVSPEAYRG